MNKPLTRDEFYNTVNNLVQDTFAFRETDLGRNMVNGHAPAEYYRHIQLCPHRAIGKTYALTRLANDFDPTLVVFSNYDLLRRVVRYYEQYGFYSTNPDYAFRVQEVLQRNFLAELGGPKHRDYRELPSRFKLGIIDDATKIHYELGDHSMHELRHVLFSCCDVVLELG